MVLSSFRVSSSSSSTSSNKSCSSYETDDSGCEKYPKMKNGAEFYFYDSFKLPIFAKNSAHDEIYAKDIYLNEMYPKRPPFFAKDRHHNIYYAKDSHFNEIYPLYKGLEVYAFNHENRALIARCHSGRERYPSNGKGNYYPVDIHGVPFRLKDENGVKYPAKTKKNEYIYLKPPILDKKHVRRKKDALNNTVYMSHPKIRNWHISADVCYLSCAMTAPLIAIAGLLLL